MKNLPRVLIIDPNKYSGMLCVETLEHVGISASWVASAKNAFHALKKKSYAVVLTEVMDDSIEAFSLFYAMKVVRIYMYTSICERTILEESIDRGAHGYIIKSHVSPEELVTLLRSHEVS